MPAGSRQKTSTHTESFSSWSRWGVRQEQKKEPGGLYCFKVTKISSQQTISFPGVISIAQYFNFPTLFGYRMNTCTKITG